MKTKMVICVRQDLNMPVGRLTAQVAHAAMRVWFNKMHVSDDGLSYSTENLSESMIKWKEEGFTKVVVWVKNEDELLIILAEAKGKNIPYAIMIDDGFPKGKETTCIAIGPDENNKIDEITKELELL